MCKKTLKKMSACLLSFLVVFTTLGMVITPQVGAVPIPNQNLCEADLDVMLLYDTSGSMNNGNPTKLSQAKIAGINFVGYFGVNDQSGLASFASSANLDKALSNDHGATQMAINSLSAFGLTNIGGGIDVASNELSNNGRTQAVKAIILLTDGKANMGPSPINKAVEAAQNGIIIFTIGLGSSVNETMLQNIAGITGGQYYYAPTPANLESIYNSIKWQLCQYGSISGCKYETDQYGNNQSIIPGWELTLTGNGYLQTQPTDQYGCCKFAGLLPGIYTLSEGTNPGIFEQTYPTANNGTYIIDLAATDHFTYDFGNYFPTCGNGVCDTNYGEDCSSCPQDCGECVPDSVTIIASKIVCDDEYLLPNWGAGGSSITSTTAIDYVAQHPGCHLTADWDFQVGDQTAQKKDGDFYGEAPSGEGWTTFGPTDSNGVTQTTVNLTPNITQLRLREVLQNGYIPFTYPPNDNPVSAEFYCADDVYKYDNYDWITSPQAGETYYCVAFNVPTEEPVYECSDGIDNDGDTLVDSDDPGCWGDINDPSTYNPTDNDESNDSLPQCSDYIDNDGDGLIDYPNDPGCDNAEDDDEYNTYCGDGNCDSNESCSSCPEDCGTCPTPPDPEEPSSGGGCSLPILKIPDKGECVVDESNVAHFSYRTSVLSSTQVVCDNKQHLDMGVKPYYGYPLYTEEFDLQPNRVMIHEATLLLDMGAGTYHCRVIADGNYPGMVKEELTCVVPEAKSVEAPVEQPVTEPCSCPQLLESYIKLGAQNDPNDVRGLEWVLNMLGYGPLPINGIYEAHDFEAVKQLQEDNSEAILVPWGINSTGYVYLTTQKFINEWYCDWRGCPREFPLTGEQQNEINYHKGSYAVLTKTLKLKK